MLKNDRNNWAPRLGFTFDTKGDGQQLLRGGWGIYYDFPYTNATILFPALAVQSNYGVVYSYTDTNGIRNPNGTFFRPGDPLPPNQLPGLAAGRARTRSPRRRSRRPTPGRPRSATPGRSTTGSGSTSKAVDIDYRDIPFRFRANPIDPATGAAPLPAVRQLPALGRQRQGRL